LTSFLHLIAMFKRFVIEKAIRVLSCLLIAFALAILPPNSAHAASGAHGVHVVLEQSETTNQVDCGERTGGSTADSGGQECCESMCLATLLLNSFAPLQLDILQENLAQRALLLVAAEANGFLRPPKPLI
jgi:hypothetical protein